MVRVVRVSLGPFPEERVLNLRGQSVSEDFLWKLFAVLVALAMDRHQELIHVETGQNLRSKFGTPVRQVTQEQLQVTGLAPIGFLDDGRYVRNNLEDE